MWLKLGTLSLIQDFSSTSFSIFFLDLCSYRLNKAKVESRFLGLLFYVGFVVCSFRTAWLPPVLWPAYLDTWLWQVDLEGHFLPHEDVRVPGFGEERLQDVQLRPREGRALSALLPGSGCKKTRRDRSTQRNWLQEKFTTFALLTGCSRATYEDCDHLNMYLLSQEAAMLSSYEYHIICHKKIPLFFFFLVIPVQFLQPQVICFAAVKRLSVFVSEQEEWAIPDWHGHLGCDEAVCLGAKPRPLLKSLLVVKRNRKKFIPPLLLSKVIFSIALH